MTAFHNGAAEKTLFRSDFTSLPLAQARQGCTGIDKGAEINSSYRPLQSTSYMSHSDGKPTKHMIGFLRAPPVPCANFIHVAIPRSLC